MHMHDNLTVPWVNVLLVLQFALNNAFSALIRQSLNKLVYSFKLRSAINVLAGKACPRVN